MNAPVIICSTATPAMVDRLAAKDARLAWVRAGKFGGKDYGALIDAHFRAVQNLEKVAREVLERE